MEKARPFQPRLGLRGKWAQTPEDMPGWWPPVQQGDSWSLQPVSSEGSSRRGREHEHLSQLFCSGGVSPVQWRGWVIRGVWMGGGTRGTSAGPLLTLHRQAGSLSRENVMAAASLLVQCPAWEGGHRSEEVAFPRGAGLRRRTGAAGGERPQYPVADPRGATGALPRRRASRKAVGGLSQHLCLGLL